MKEYHLMEKPHMQVSKNLLSTVPGSPQQLRLTELFRSAVLKNYPNKAAQYCALIYKINEHCRNTNTEKKKIDEKNQRGKQQKKRSDSFL